MIESRLLRSDPDAVRDSQTRRGADPAAVDRFLAADQQHRLALQQFEELRAQQKQLSKKIGPARGAAKRGELDATQQSELDAWMAQAEQLAGQVKQAEAHAAELEPEVRSAAVAIDNLVDLRAPVGGEEDFSTVATVGSPRDFATEGF